jgi:hypothetical protein
VQIDHPEPRRRNGVTVASREIVKDHNIVPLIHQLQDDVRLNIAGTACYQYSRHNKRLTDLDIEHSQIFALGVLLFRYLSAPQVR